MGYPHIINVHLWNSSCSEYLKWLEEQHITKYRWDWKGRSVNGGDEKQYLRFRFENEQDKLLFALRWA